MRSLAIVLVISAGCGGPVPIAPETDAQSAARVFAKAQELEAGQKSKQAMAAYHQIVLHFPNTPEAKKAAQRIADAHRTAAERVRTRKSR